MQSYADRRSVFPIVERLPEPKPVCTWLGRPGVLTLAKGWVARNEDGRMWFYNRKPKPALHIGQWNITIADGGMARQLGNSLFTDLPVFNPDLPWTEHIVEVEGEEPVVVKEEWNGKIMEVPGKACEPMDCVEIGPKIADYERIHDGWVAQDVNGDLYWYSIKPETNHIWNGEWLYSHNGDIGPNSVKLTRNEVIFPESMPWDQRIVRIVNNQIVRDE